MTVLETFSLRPPNGGNEVSKTFIDYSGKKNRYDIDDGKEKNDIGIEFSNENSNSSIYKKKIHLNGKKIKKQSDLAELISVIWLTPEMDIFFGSNSMAFI